MTDQLAELKQQGETLLRLTEQESELVRLEERLAHNLDSVRVIDTLEETLPQFERCREFDDRSSQGKGRLKEQQLGNRKWQDRRVREQCKWPAPAGKTEDRSPRFPVQIFGYRVLFPVSDVSQ